MGLFGRRNQLELIEEAAESRQEVERVRARALSDHLNVTRASLELAVFTQTMKEVAHVRARTAG